MRRRSTSTPEFRYREQLTAADCFPTSVLNALGGLFPRVHLPPAVVQRVYLYSLDSVGRGESHGKGGTSASGGYHLAEWLADYRTTNFGVTTEYLEEGDVHLDARSPIVTWLRSGGRAVIDVVAAGGAVRHSVLLTAIGRNHVELWDPFHRRAPHRHGRGKIEYLAGDGTGPNFRIDRGYFTSRHPKSTLALGPLADRACVLIDRAR